jgi:hypothetical protein
VWDPQVSPIFSSCSPLLNGGRRSRPSGFRPLGQRPRLPIVEHEVVGYARHRGGVASAGRTALEQGRDRGTPPQIGRAPGKGAAPSSAWPCRCASPSCPGRLDFLPQPEPSRPPGFPSTARAVPAAWFRISFHTAEQIYSRQRHTVLGEDEDGGLHTPWSA